MDDITKFNLLSPRIGFSYDFGKDAKTVLHGSFGVYYNKITTLSYRSSLPGNGDSYHYSLILPTAPFDITDESIKEMFTRVAQPENYIMTYTHSTPIPVDPDFKQTRADYYNIGLSKQLGDIFSLSIDYVYKRDLNKRQWLSLTPHTYEESLWTDPWHGNTITIWEQTDDLSNEDLFLTNSTWAKKRHHIIMIVLRKQPSRRWSMMASYVYQNSKGNLPDWGDNDLFVAQNLNMDRDPYYLENPLHWGRQYDREHQFKLLVSYFGPWGIHLSGNFQALSGIPWQAEVSSYYLGISRSPRSGTVWPHSFNVLLEPRGSRRTPFNWNFDLRLAKAFNIKGTHLELQIDIFNLFNNDYYSYVYTSPIDVYLDGTPAFGLPTRLNPPRHVRFGVSWRF
jgi:outer membrane receptor protein involved in Fe transport